MRKFVLAMLVAVCTVCVAFAVAACAPKVKMHDFSDKWAHDANTHYHKCQDSGCKATTDPEPHEWVLTDEIRTEATCGTAGYGTYKCSVCGVLRDMQIPATGEHRYVDTDDMQPANCGRPGYVIQECEVCQHRERREIEPTGLHTFEGEWHDSEEGVVGAEGSHYQICVECGEHSDPVSHVAVEKPSSNPKMDDVRKIDGKVTVRCQYCGHIMEEYTEYASEVPVSFNVRLSRRGTTQYLNITDNNGMLEVTLTAMTDNTTDYTLGVTDLVDREGNPISRLPSGVDIEVWYITSTGNFPLDISSQGFTYAGKTYGTLSVSSKENLKEQGVQWLRIQLVTGGDTEYRQIRAVRNLYVTINWKEGNQ